MGIYLEIKDMDNLITFLMEVKRNGLLKDISLNEVRHSISDDAFPIRLPINIEGVMKVIGNPIIKGIFGKNIEERTRTYLKKAMNAG